MSSRWLEQSRAFIRELDKDIPADATLKDRRKVLRANGWRVHGYTYWGRKQWGKAAREYLARHGAPPRKLEESKDPRLLAAMQRGDIVFPFRGGGNNGDDSRH